MGGVLFLLAHPGSAQPINDQPTELLAGVGDNRASLLVELAQQYRRTDPQRSMSYAEEALGLLDPSADSENLALVWDVMAWHKLNQGLYEDALALSGQAMQSAGASTRPALGGQLFYTLGAIQLTRGNVTLAQHAFEQAVSFLERADDIAFLARAYSAMGGCFRHFGEFETAMAWHQLAYETAMKTQDHDVKSMVLNNLGDLYDHMERPQQALEYYQQSLDLEPHVQPGHVVRILNIGTQYQVLQRYSEALSSYEQALKLSRELKLGQHEPEIMVAFAATYVSMGDPDTALSWSQQALESASRAGVEVQIIGALNSLSQTYLALRNYNLAIAASERALGLAQRQEVPQLILDTLRQLATAYKSAGRFKEALMTLETYTGNYQKMLEDRAGRRLAELQSLLESEVSEREIERLQQENQIRALELQQERNRRIVWISPVAILVLIIVFLVMRYFTVQRLSRTDELTQIPNRNHLSMLLEQEFRRFQRYGNPCCLMILDIDDFKAFNDSYGHDCGDRVLAEVARVVTDNVRNADRVGRWGGEEFVVLFPQTQLSESRQVAERVRRAVEQYRLPVPSADSAKTTELAVNITGGLAALAADDADVGSWLKRADQALYEGKQAGKNRVEAGPELQRDANPPVADTTTAIGAPAS